VAVYDGSGWVYKTADVYPKAGSVLQVVSTTKDDAFSSSSTSLTDVTGLSAVITPSATSSKVLVVVTCQIGHDSTGLTQCTITDSANAILIPAVSPGSRTIGFANSGTAGIGITPAVFSFLHSPNTTSSFTYKIRARTNSGNFHINRDNTNADNANSTRTSSVITLMEISA
jgi:hypothetical protein